MNDLMMLALEVNMSDNQIKDCIQQMMPVCIAKGQGFCLTISGFDDDKRDLWQIPEATRFMKRLVDLGLIAGLEVSTNSDFSRTIQGIKLPGLGALEIWLIGNGKLSSGDNEITKPIMDEFFQVLNEANMKAKAVCLEPLNTGMAENGWPAWMDDICAGQIPDHRLSHWSMN